MPDFSQSMELFAKLGSKQHVARDLLNDVLDAQGLVRFREIRAFHRTITAVRHGFVLRDNSPKFVRPGGRQLFYVNGPILVRVKTTGTDRRPTPHMTVSLSEDLSWPGEAAKFNRQGEVVPRVGPVSTAPRRTSGGRSCGWAIASLRSRRAMTGGRTPAISISCPASTARLRPHYFPSRPELRT
jgi:hypothetical protein